MDGVKRYGQYCAVARSLDVIGDRWTLLVVRELLLGPATYTQLQHALPGVATNLLSERLRRMASAGLVRRDAAGGSRAPYELTPRGDALRPVLLELIRWGAPLMVSGPGGDAVDGRWSALALEALLAGEYSGPLGRLRVHCGDTVVDVVSDSSGRHVERAADGAAPDPDAVVRGSLPAILRAAHEGRLGAELETVGSRRTATRLLRREVAPAN